MRRIALVTALILGVAAIVLAEPVPAFAPTPGNLFLNGSFEHNQDNDAYPDHWEFVNYAPGGEIRWVTDDSREGRAGVRMSAPQGGQVILKPDGNSNTALPCGEGRSYVLSLWVRSEGPFSMAVQMTGQFADGTSRWEVGGGYVRTQEALPWTRYTWKFKGPAGIRTMSPWISHQQGTAVVDCFQVEEAAEATPYAPPAFARLYLEPKDAKFTYALPDAFAPELLLTNETVQEIKTTLEVTLAEVWGEGTWTLKPVRVTVAPGKTATVKIAGAPGRLKPNRYRLSLSGRDEGGEVCCDTWVELTLAALPNGPLPRFPRPELPITAELQSVADGYSRLLVEMAGLEELLRQLERGLFYAANAGLDPEDRATEALRERLSEAEGTLAASRLAYNEAYGVSFEERRKPKTLTAEQRQARDASLATVAANLTALEGQVPGLRADLEKALGELTKAVAGRIMPGFKPSVVGHPGQAQQELTLDSKGRASGIIWGICGHPGNVLRIQRWFGFGSSLGGRPDMSGPGRLQRGPWNWFNGSEYREYQREGLKYDANYYVGGPVNAAATHYFLAANAGNPDILMQTSTGETPSASTLNIWNPLVQAQVRDFCTTQAKLLREDPRCIYHYYAWEPSFAIPGGKDHGGVETGYNPTARADFRRYLREKFSTIAALNEAWGSDYESFEAIEPPPDGSVVPRKHATPLTYEFEKWRQKSYADYWQLCYEAIKTADPDRPVGVSGEGSASFFNSNCYTDGIDYWQLAKRAMDFVETHSELYLGLPDIIWEHSIARLLNKPQLFNESNWDWSAPSHKQDERQWQATGEISLWRWLAWGRTYINIMSAESEYVPPTAFYGQSLLEMQQDYTILRESARFMKIAMDKSSRYGDLLLSTRIATPKIAVLQSNTSIINCYPSGSPTGGYPHHPPRQEAFNFAALNQPRNYDHLYVPEEAVLEEGHDLRQYRAVVVPYATHFPPGLTEKLLAYVERGGWLICSGPPGVYDAYGREDNRLLRATLGLCRPEYVSGNENTWVWALNAGELRPEAKVELRDAQGAAVIVSGGYGKGGIVVSLAGWRTEEAKAVYLRAVETAVGHRTAWCEGDKLELVTRVDGKGRRYLLVMNRSVDDTSEDTVHVEGEWAHPVDLGIGQRFPLPAEVKGGFTSFRVRLERGDATVIALE